MYDVRPTNLRLCLQMLSNHPAGREIENMIGGIVGMIVGMIVELNVLNANLNGPNAATETGIGTETETEIGTENGIVSVVHEAKRKSDPDLGKESTAHDLATVTEKEGDNDGVLCIIIIINPLRAV